jgi:hypothetical protein
VLTPTVAGTPAFVVVKDALRFPSVKVAPALKLAKGFNVAKLLVGVSVVWSIDVRLLTVKSFPSPEVSSPSAELSLNSK